MNRKVREWLESLIPAAIIVAVMFILFWPFSISGSSMEDSFFDRDRIAVSRVLVWSGKISRGNFVVCRMKRGGRMEHVIKRVLGLPGDHVEIKAGKVYINDELVDEAYARGHTSGEVYLRLADGEFFVMGDNREDSYDSRASGPVLLRDMVGKVLIRWYPFDKITVY